VLVAAPDVAERLEPAREAMAGATAEWGLGVLDGLLLGRLIAPDAAALRADLARLMTHLTASALPRSWQT
jgi:urease accessory protein